jgi:hypothetical protein
MAKIAYTKSLMGINITTILALQKKKKKKLMDSVNVQIVLMYR